MTTAYQPPPRWEQPVPMAHEKLPLASRNLFSSSYDFDPNLTPRDSSVRQLRQPSQHSAAAAALHVDPYQPDQIKHDSERSMRKGSSVSRNSSPQKSAMSHTRRPSTSHSRVSVQAAEPHVESDIPVPIITDAERSAWIHRDKLARIESQEMAAAGFDLPTSTHRRQSRSEIRSASRPISRNASSGARSKDRHANQPAFTADDAANSYMPVFEEQTGEGASQAQDSDDYEERLREEPRMDRGMYNRSLPRPIVSRIPVARASPAPGSIQASSSVSSRLGNSARDRRRSRSLGNSAAMTVDFGSSPSAVPSSSRPHSSHMQDSTSAANSPSLSQRTTQSMTSASRAKALNKAATGSVGRKNPPRTTAKPLNTSPKNSPTRRQSTNSNRPRPSSLVSRPEGEAPWIAHMYKPDPMLPPDEQMLPTHAKRSMYGEFDKQDEADKPFPVNIDLLSDEELARMGALPPPEGLVKKASPSVEQQDAKALSPPWPLNSKKSDANSRAESAKSATGGYSITPRIAPSIAPTKSSQPTRQQPGKPTIQRVPDVDEKEGGKKKKKLACCIVM